MSVPFPLSDLVTNPKDLPPADEAALPQADSAQEVDLPEWEPLTPELVEEEAIRGDFMLRWAAILLALLLGWTVIDRTDVLVHIKTGQYLASHGVLPPSTDVFSATAQNRRWVNLSWLWDLLVGGIDAAVGPAGLSLLSAVIACATFWLVVRTCIPSVPTWWGSVCAVLAVVACFPSLTATPHLVTLLGVACTLYLLYRQLWQSATSLWPLVGLFLIWGNLDGRAWIGGVILILFALGTWLDSFRKLPEGDAQPPARPIALAALCSLLALLVHPFLWETWLAPLRLYGIEYPALAAYASSDQPFLFERFPIATPSFWKDVEYFNAVSLLLMLMGSVTLLLNRGRLRLSTALVFLGVNLIGLAGGGELAVVSIVNAIVATISGQQWYRSTFRQSYSLDPGEILFSRVGRALTVMAIFALAFAGVSGHLMGAQGRRIGMGLSPELSQTIASYESVLADPFDIRAFNFRPEQGDVLIWIGMQPFIDSRFGLYGGENSLIPLHHIVRQALITSSEPAKEFWSNVFDQYEVYQVLPRLSGYNPDYGTYLSLLRSPNWQLAGQGAATAAFYRTDSDNAQLSAYLKQHDETDFVSRYLQTESDAAEDAVSRGVWPRAPSFYDAYVYLPSRTTPNGIRLAAHDNLLRELAIRSERLDEAIALAYGAIRHAREGLRENPHHAEGYRILGIAYQFLEAVESSIQQSQGQSHPLAGRFYQAATAFHQVLDCKPGDADAQYRLFETYYSHLRQDLALYYLELFEEATGQNTTLEATDRDFKEQQQSNSERKAELQKAVEQVRAQIAQSQQGNKDRFTIAQEAYAAGCPLLALELLEEDLTIAASNPAARMLMGMLLLEVGRGAEALDQLESLRHTPIEEHVPEWPLMTAYANLAADEVLTAKTTLEQAHTHLAEMMATALLASAPMHFIGPERAPDGTLVWPDREGMEAVAHAQAVSVLNSTVQTRSTQNELFQALIALETGGIFQATELLVQIVDRDPHSPARPLIEQYLLLITGKQLPPPETIEQLNEPDLFGEIEPEEPKDGIDPEQSNEE